MYYFHFPTNIAMVYVGLFYQMSTWNPPVKILTTQFLPKDAQIAVAAPEFQD